MKKETNNLTRGEKILLFLYEYGNKGEARVRYEDIVVGVFKKYPTDFQLKGYKEYPDSGDLIHKPLYDFKKKGYVNAANKIFSLTERGIEYAKRLGGKGSAPTVGDRLSRSTSTEVIRIKSLEGFGLFSKGNENLSENDFYNYLGVTVRTPKNAFIGRLETMNAVADELRKHPDDPLHAAVVKYHEFLLGRFQNIKDFFTKK
jgi:hypothetical protein